LELFRERREANPASSKQVARERKHYQADAPQSGLVDAETMKKLIEEAVASVPSGRTNVALVSQEKNLVFIDRKGNMPGDDSLQFSTAKITSARMMFLNSGNQANSFRVASAVPLILKICRGLSSAGIVPGQNL
jgi:hypothetical protein